jgi:hypothetical protein
MHNFVILNVTEGGVRDLLYLPFNIGAKRRSTNANTVSATDPHAPGVP